LNCVHGFEIYYGTAAFLILVVVKHVLVNAEPALHALIVFKDKPRVLRLVQKVLLSAGLDLDRVESNRLHLLVEENLVQVVIVIPRLLVPGVVAPLAAIEAADALQQERVGALVEGVELEMTLLNRIFQKNAWSLFRLGLSGRYN